MDQENVKVLDNFRVVAIRGKGIWIVDEDGNCWHVGGPHDSAEETNKLVETYRGAFPDEQVS